MHHSMRTNSCNDIQYISSKTLNDLRDSTHTLVSCFVNQIPTDEVHCSYLKTVFPPHLSVPAGGIKTDRFSVTPCVTTVYGKKSIPWSCLPLSKQPLGIFMWNFTRLLLVHIHKTGSGIWLPSVTAKLQNFLCDHLVIFAYSKISVQARL